MRSTKEEGRGGEEKKEGEKDRGKEEKREKEMKEKRKEKGERRRRKKKPQLTMDYQDQTSNRSIHVIKMG